MLTKLSTLRNRGVSEEGFTLIELIIVVVIIGILSAIAIPIFLNQQKSAIAAGVKSDVRNTNTNIATALVKAPTATAIGAGGASVLGTVVATSTTTPADKAAATVTANGDDITVGSGAAKTVLSDTNSFLVVQGDWQGYSISGQNTGLAGEYLFNSKSGKYTGTADLA